MGHVLAAVAHAAALLGWRARLVNLDSGALAHCLGLDREEEYAGVELEEPECLVAITAADEAASLPPMEWDEWSGVPSLLDPNPMYAWPVIEEAAEASRGPLPSSGQILSQIGRASCRERVS
jgi:hypothetical protein